MDKKMTRTRSWLGWVVLIVGFILVIVRTRKPRRQRRKVSSGVKAIRQWLNSNGIPFQEEYPVTIDGRRFRFDFYIPVRNLLIEFDGVQHFDRNDFFHPKPGDFEASQDRDRIKTEWVKKSGRTLIRIASGDDINRHLSQGFQTTGVYFSSPGKYEYLQ